MIRLHIDSLKAVKVLGAEDIFQIIVQGTIPYPEYSMVPKTEYERAKQRFEINNLVLGWYHIKEEE